MIWMFLVLSLGAVAYMAYLVLDHLREAGLIDVQIDRQQQEQKNVEFSIKRSEIDRDSAKTKVVEIGQEAKQLQITTDDLQSQISDLNKDKERRGKFRLGGS